MKFIAGLFFCFTFFSGILLSQSQLPSYYLEDEFGIASPVSYRYGLYGYVNPAILGMMEEPDFYFAWSDQTGRWNDFNNYGLFTSFPHLGFYMINTHENPYSVTDYKFSSGFGTEAASVGMGYAWSSGDYKELNHSDYFTLGTLFRPIQYLSFGLVGNLSTSNKSEGMVDVAVRPFGNELLSVYGDYAFGSRKLTTDLKWSTGAVAEVLPGIRISGRYLSNHYFNVGAELSFGRIGLTTESHYSNDGKYGYNIYGIRIGAYDRNIFSGISSNKDYVKFDLIGGLKYQKYRLFDNSKTLYNTLREIDAATNDKSVSGIVLNLSGMEINKEMIWELREKLEAFKNSGKHIVVYLDRVGIDGYYLASVANKIIMNPEGMITLEGYIWGRQYYAGLLEKIGIGFTEWRYFKYKSAMETFSRKNMSEADSIQWKAIIDTYYYVTKDGICSSRKFSSAEFDSLVNETTLFLPESALRHRLVDTLARWEDIDDLITKYEGENKTLVDPRSLNEFQLPNDDYWGKKPEIAIVYAIGECAMDNGIKARELVKVIKSLSENSDVKALVFRVDSPGGDGLASDIVAEAIKKCKEKKPVIVSQGYVAGSGGYWLSMYGDEIYAAPNTITGSIGVIGGWYYNKSLKEYFGVSTDLIQIGKHADLGFGMKVPFIGIPLPDRDLTKTEMKEAEKSIKDMYHDFVGKVASGRHMSYDEVQEIAQGRVWSGIDGKEIKIVDKLGGLYDAINEAVEKAGLKGSRYEIKEYPEAPWFDFSILAPKIFGIDTQTNPEIEHLLFRLKFNGIPLYILPLEDMSSDFPLSNF